jgi:hypothetical protein
MTKFLTPLLLLAFVACGQTNGRQESKRSGTETNDNWKTFSGTGYSIQYPSTWELNQSAQMGTSFILFSPLENSQDQFRENVNLIVQDLTGQNIDLDKYSQISEEQVKTMITNSSLIESKRIKKHNGEYHRMVYTGDQDIFHLKFEQYYWVISDKAYVLTLTCEQDKFDYFKQIGENILNSFLFKK